MLGNTLKKIKINRNIYELWQIVARLDEVLRYKPESRGFDSREGHWDFSFRPHNGPGVDLTSNRKEYQEYIPG
jgi:hypothetical protein